MGSQNGSSIGGTSTTIGSSTSTLSGTTGGTPSIQGFGAQYEAVAVPGFGEPLATATFGGLSTTASAASASPSSLSGLSASTSTSEDRDESRFSTGASFASNTPATTPATVTPATTTPNPSGDAGDRIQKYAQAMVSKYDANKDGTLQREEWSQMGNEPEKADSNSDGQITLDELYVRLGGTGTVSSTSTTASSSPGGESSVAASDSSSDNGDREGFGRRREFGGGGFGRREDSRSRTSANGSGRPYRFLTPAERLPPGLPSSFTGKDRDRDGQVTMAEFATTWTQETLADFNRWDLNRDGWITAKECLTAEGGRQ
jgi:Ca2+-binding EF-hand superfamily protein